MPKIKILLSILLLSFLITSCWVEKKEDKIKEPVEKVNIDKVEIDENDLSWKAEDDINKERLEISLDNISRLYVDEFYKPKNELEKVWKKFIEELDKFEWDKITDNINWWITKDFQEKQLEKYSKILIRNFNLELTIKDSKTKENIKQWDVYVNGVIVWKFQEWKFVWKFSWLKWIENFNIMIRTLEYWDWFINLNSLNSEWSLLMWDVLLKKAQVEEVELWKKQELKINNTIIWLNKCTIVDKAWDCVKWKIKIKINHITWSEANNYEVSLNRKAITKEWKIVELESWWMSYINFIGEDWENLKVWEWELIKIWYNITKEDIATMSNKKMWSGKNEWYWYYDKNKSIWMEWTADFILDKENMTWTVETVNLY